MGWPHRCGVTIHHVNIADCLISSPNLHPYLALENRPLDMDYINHYTLVI